MYKLAVFDVDGTLVSRGKRVLQASTIEALHTLKKAGVKIAIASGRPPFAMEKELLKKIDFDFFVCSNGTYVMDECHKELYKEEMSKETVESFSQDFRDNDDALMFQFEDNAYIYHGKKRISSMIDHCLGRLDLLKDDRKMNTRHHTSLPYAIVCNIKKKNLHGYMEKYPSYSFVEFMKDYYDIFPDHCNKATGIKHLCDKIGITMEEVISFGDALNDVEMLRDCGCGVAMGDALQETKEVANHITTTSDEDGIYQACKHFGFIS